MTFLGFQGVKSTYFAHPDKGFDQFVRQCGLACVWDAWAWAWVVYQVAGAFWGCLFSECFSERFLYIFHDCFPRYVDILYACFIHVGPFDEVGGGVFQLGAVFDDLVV